MFSCCTDMKTCRKFLYSVIFQGYILFRLVCTVANTNGVIMR